MLFLINEEKKVIFGWSAKCGCSHVKNLFYYLQEGVFCEPNQSVHRGHDFQHLPENLSSYTLILFIRNPYKRLVSGFLDKYGPNGEFLHLWDDSIPLTFSNFVDKIAENSKMIDHHHFTPQTTEHFNDCIRDLIKDHSKTFIFDINNIDYKLIEYIFGKVIPQEVLEYRGEHCQRLKTPKMSEIYTNDIMKNVEDIYRKDFQFFIDRGFVFTI